MEFPLILDQTRIQELIPHRPPFLWLEEATLVDGHRLLARQYVDPGLELFAGHYPQFPVLPGVIQCEAAFQAGAVLIALTAPPVQGEVPVVTRLSQVQFRRMVRPGETLDIEVELAEKLANAFFLKGKVSVAGSVSVRLEFACAAARPAS